MSEIHGLVKAATYLHDARQKLLAYNFSATNELVHCINYLLETMADIVSIRHSVMTANSS